MSEEPTALRREPGGPAEPAHPTPALLVLYSGGRIPLGTLYRLGRRAVIGRGPDADILLNDDDTVSKRHAEIECGPDGIRLRDLGSTNHTYVDGSRADGPSPCRHGSVVRVGDHLFELVMDADSYQDLAPGPGPRIGGPALRRVERAVRDFAKSDLPILLTGESGTGKELLAELAHDASGRPGPLVAVNCAAVPEGTAESQLFGHRRGAFTDAVADAPGLIRSAHGGTLFLDEIGEMPGSLQPKLLRALELREVTPVGGTPVRVDFRLVCATNRDLRAQVAAGKFREDLYFRIAAAEIQVPPLRERREDIVMLVEHVRREVGPECAFTVEALERLCLHAWPGNVRELLWAVRCLLVRARSARAEERGAQATVTSEVVARERRVLITAAATAERLYVAGAGGEADADSDEEARILQALEACAGNVVDAARKAGVSRSGVYRLLEKLGRTPDEFRKR